MEMTQHYYNGSQWHCLWWEVDGIGIWSCLMPGFGNAMPNMHVLLPVLGSSKQVNKKRLHIWTQRNTEDNKYKSHYMQVFFMWFLLCDFALKWLENLHHFLNLCDYVKFNTTWHRQYAIIFNVAQCGIHDPRLNVLCWRLAESDVTVTPKVTHMDYVSDIIMRLI
jgi:hypothetical protein